MTSKHRLMGLLFMVACCTTVHGAVPFACDPDNAGLTLPEGFCALVAADDLGTARHAVVAPNGDLYVALQSGRGKTGGVVALRDENGDGRFEIKEHFGDGSSTGIALRNGYLYVAKVESVERWKAVTGPGTSLTADGSRRPRPESPPAPYRPPDWRLISCRTPRIASISLPNPAQSPDRSAD